MDLKNAEKYAAIKNDIDEMIAGHRPERVESEASPNERFLALMFRFDTMSGVLHVLALPSQGKRVMEISGTTPSGKKVAIELETTDGSLDMDEQRASSLQAVITCDGQRLPAESITDAFDEEEREIERRLGNLEETFSAAERLVAARQAERRASLVSMS